MSKGRKRWTELAGPLVVSEALGLLRSGQAHSSVYRTLDLARFVTGGVFAAWVREERRAGRIPDSGGTAAGHADGASAGSQESPASTWGSGSPPASPSVHSTPGELLNACLNSLRLSIAANTLPEYRLADVIRALAKLSEIDIKERAERRALELHETKMAEFRKLQETALETASETARLSPEQVAEIRAKVLGL